MELIGLVAEALTVAWFVLFFVLIRGLMSESDGHPAPRPDAVGKRLIGSARLAFTIGIPAMFVAEIVHQLGLLG